MTDKTASGIIIYLQEELGDARLRAEQLSQMIKAGTDLIEKSSHKDHFFEVAGHLIHGVPDVVFKLSKALDAAALAAAKLDYEEIKQGLKPEKVEELEKVLDDARLRYLKRRSHEEPMNPKNAARILSHIATEIEATGTVPVAQLAGLIAELESGAKTASDQPTRALRTLRTLRTLHTLRGAAEHLMASEKPNRKPLIAALRKILADSDMTTWAGAGEEFQKHNPKITDEEAAEIDEMHEKNKDVVKDKAKEANGPLPLTTPEEDAAMIPAHFDAMVDSAKDALRAAVQNRGAVAVSKAMGTIMNAGQCIKYIAPQYGSDLSYLINKASLLTNRIRSEARSGDVDELSWGAFQVAVIAAKKASAAIKSKNERQASSWAMETILAIAEAVQMVAPEYGSDLADIIAKAQRLGTRIKSEAGKTNVLATRYGGDPFWMKAKYPGVDANGNRFERGEKIFFYPRTKTILTGEQAEEAAREFGAMAADEDFYNHRASGDLEDACWDGYEAVGLKPGQNGGEVPNCVPVKSASVDAEDWKAAGAGAEFQKHNPKITDEQVEEIDRMHEKHKDVVKGKTAKLMGRQELILRKYVQSGGTAMMFDDLPPNVQSDLRRVKDQETLWSDVDRWLSDNGSRRWASIDVEAAASGTVGAFVWVLKSLLTQYDKRLEARQPNIYRLGHLLEAAGKVEDDVAAYKDRDDPEALEALKKSVSRRFIVRDMPPAAALIKKIDQFLASGKPPRLAAVGEYTVLKTDVKSALRQIADVREVFQKALGSAMAEGSASGDPSLDKAAELFATAQDYLDEIQTLLSEDMGLKVARQHVALFDGADPQVKAKILRGVRICKRQVEAWLVDTLAYIVNKAKDIPEAHFAAKTAQQTLGKLLKTLDAMEDAVR